VLSRGRVPTVQDLDHQGHSIARKNLALLFAQGRDVANNAEEYGLERQYPSLKSPHVRRLWKTLEPVFGALHRFGCDGDLRAVVLRSVGHLGSVAPAREGSRWIRRGGGVLFGW
jgi:hypothetical protein